MLGLTEAALEAWAECRPEGMMLAEDRLPALLPGIAVRIPGGLSTPERARRLNDLFNSKVSHSDQPPLFLEMLTPTEGQVHFLNFWQAFSEATHLVAGPFAPTASAGTLEAELEGLRDRVLLLLEEAETCSSATRRQIQASVLVDAVHGTASSSTVPAFWRAVAESVSGLQDEAVSIGPEEIAVIMLSWLHDATAWRQLPPRPPNAAPAQGRKPGAAAGAGEDPDDQGGQPVFLHVYDVSQEESIQKLNKVLAHKHSPLKLGGVFHAGVEVNGLEWSYGFSMSETVPGISCSLPKQHPQHHFRQTILLRRTRLSREDVADIISKLIEEYPGDDYDVLRRNCCHFADDFCQRLGIGRIPGWVYRLARLGARLDGALQVAQGLQEKFRGVLLPDDKGTEQDQGEVNRQALSR